MQRQHGDEFAADRVPESRLAIGAAGREPPAVARHGDDSQMATVAFELPLDRSGVGSDRERLIVRHGHDGVGIEEAEGFDVRLLGQAGHVREGPAGDDWARRISGVVDRLDRKHPRGTRPGQSPAIGSECDAEERRLFVGHLAQECSGRRPPEPRTAAAPTATRLPSAATRIE